MIKLLYLLRRRPELSLEEFQGHWLERHSRFGIDNRAVLRYVQYHTLANDPIRESLAQAESSGAREPYDGMMTAWFESAESMRACMSSDLVQAALEDERLFIDHERSVAMVVDERVQVEPIGPSPIVLVECLQRPDSIDRATFGARWLEHARIGKRAHAAGLLAGYIQNHAFPEDHSRVDDLDSLGTSREDWDGVVTAYFQSIAIAKELFRSPLASEEAFEDERSFMDHTKSVYMMTRRHPIKDLIR